MSVTVLQQRIREKKTPLALGLRPEPDKLSSKILNNFTDMFGPGSMAEAEALRWHGTTLLDAAAEKLPAVMLHGASYLRYGSMGGLVKLDPSRVKMDDGRFELLLLRMPKSALDLQNLITAMTRMQYDYPGVIFRHVQHVTLTTQTHIPWSLDGEYAPSAARVDIENLPGAVSLLR